MQVKGTTSPPASPSRTAIPAAGSSVHWTDACSGLTLNGRMRDELLNETLFFGIDHAREALAR
jgi:hypothetical protein